jgi:hypothetical protein
MGRRSIMGGVRTKGFRRIQFDFEIGGVRFRPCAPQLFDAAADRSVNASTPAAAGSICRSFSQLLPQV